MQFHLPLSGYPNYSITEEGDIYYKGQLKQLIRKPGRSVKVRVRHKGTVRELGVASLLAKSFLPNPENYTRIIFKDGNGHNCTIDNIKWVSNRDFVRTNLFPGKSLEIKSKSRKSKPLMTASATMQPSDPSAVEITGYPGYYISPTGKCYHHGILLRPHGFNAGKSLTVRIKNNGNVKNLGLAKLVAQVFIPNPESHTRIIFKDRNNRNCRSDNIAWASEKQYNSYTESFKHSSYLSEEAIDLEAKAIPGYEGYLITPIGKLFYKGAMLRLLKGKADRSPRVRLRRPTGKPIRIAVATLVALTFIPNPRNHPKIIFKDRNNQNFTKENLQWVSLADWSRFVNKTAENAELLGHPISRKETKQVWIDPMRVPLDGFPGYYISPAGIVYKENNILKPVRKRGKSLKVRIYKKENGIRKYSYPGLATLLARHFIPNPNNHKHIIFKDRNNHNCIAENIAWVDGQTFMYYAGVTKFQTGRKKIVIDRREAIRVCTDEYLRNYYITLDEHWLHECWKRVEQKIKLYEWEYFRSECYLYFIDRAKRFSLLKDPVGLMIIHTKGVKARLRKEISPDIPLSLLFKTDESMRNTRRSGREYHYDVW